MIPFALRRNVSKYIAKYKNLAIKSVCIRDLFCFVLFYKRSKLDIFPLFVGGEIVFFF